MGIVTSCWYNYHHFLTHTNTQSDVCDLQLPARPWSEEDVPDHRESAVSNPHLIPRGKIYPTTMLSLKVVMIFFFVVYMKVGLFGYITYCKVEIKGDILANFSLDFISQLTRLGNIIVVTYYY